MAWHGRFRGHLQHAGEVVGVVARTHILVRHVFHRDGLGRQGLSQLPGCRPQRLHACSATRGGKRDALRRTDDTEREREMVERERERWLRERERERERGLRESEV
jgi:hypothetical protein